jgi:hypothetical protein
MSSRNKMSAPNAAVISRFSAGAPEAESEPQVSLVGNKDWTGGRCECSGMESETPES